MWEEMGGRAAVAAHRDLDLHSAPPCPAHRVSEFKLCGASRHIFLGVSFKSLMPSI